MHVLWAILFVQRIYSIMKALKLEESLVPVHDRMSAEVILFMGESRELWIRK